MAFSSLRPTRVWAPRLERAALRIHFSVILKCFPSHLLKNDFRRTATKMRSSKRLNSDPKDFGRVSFGLFCLKRQGRAEIIEKMLDKKKKTESETPFGLLWTVRHSRLPFLER